jgi:hypothetical protein
MSLLRSVRSLNRRCDEFEQVLDEMAEFPEGSVVRHPDNPRSAVTSPRISVRSTVETLLLRRPQGILAPMNEPDKKRSRLTQKVISVPWPHREGQRSMHEPFWTS